MWLPRLSSLGRLILGTQAPHREEDQAAHGRLLSWAPSGQRAPTCQPWAWAMDPSGPSWPTPWSRGELFLRRQVKLHEWNTCCCKPLSVVMVCYKETDNWNSFPHKRGQPRVVHRYNSSAAPPVMPGQQLCNTDCFRRHGQELERGKADIYITQSYIRWHLRFLLTIRFRSSSAS